MVNQSENTPMSIFSALAQSGPDVLIQIKVVPGASRSRVMGMLGDRVKVAVAAPPEDGKANQAVCALLAKVLGVKAVTICVGQTNARKTVRVGGMTVEDVAGGLTGPLP